MPCMKNRAGAVRLRGFLRCLSKHDVDLVRRHLPEHLRLTREEPGCISFEVSETDDPLIWRVEELLPIVPPLIFISSGRGRRSGLWRPPPFHAITR